MSRTLVLGVFVATLLILSQGLSLSHDQVNPTPTANTATPATTTTTTAPSGFIYHTWDYINGRKMALNHCFHVLPADENTIFTWQPNNLHIEGPCGTANCAFTINEKEITFTGCTPATLPAPCGDYIARITRSHHVSLVSNLIKFFSTDDTSVVPNFVLADKKWSSNQSYLVNYDGNVSVWVNFNELTADYKVSNKQITHIFVRRAHTLSTYISNT